MDPVLLTVCAKWVAYTISLTRNHMVVKVARLNMANGSPFKSLSFKVDQ